MKLLFKVLFFSLLAWCTSLLPMAQENFNQKMKQIDAKINTILLENDNRKAIQSYMLSIDALKEYLRAAALAAEKEIIIEKVLSTHALLLKRIAQNLDVNIEPIFYVTQAKQDLAELVKAGYPLTPQSEALANAMNEILGYSSIIEAAQPLTLAIAHWKTKSFPDLEKDLKNAVYKFYFLDSLSKEQKKLANKRLAYAYDLLIKLYWNNNLNKQAKTLAKQAQLIMNIIKDEQMIDISSTGYKNLISTLDKLNK